MPVLSPEIEKNSLLSQIQRKTINCMKFWPRTQMKIWLKYKVFPLIWKYFNMFLINVLSSNLEIQKIDLKIPVLSPEIENIVLFSKVQMKTINCMKYQHGMREKPMFERPKMMEIKGVSVNLEIFLYVQSSNFKIQNFWVVKTFFPATPLSFQIPFQGQVLSFLRFP